MTLFCAIRRDSVSLFKFPFRSHVPVFKGKISLVCHSKYLYSCFFFPFLFSYYCRSVCPTLSMLLLVVVISLYLLFFLCRLRVLVFMHSSNLSCLQVIFLVLLMTHRVCLYYFSDVRPWPSSSTFFPLVHLSTFFSCPFYKWFQVSYKGSSPIVCAFDEIPGA